MVRGKKKEVNEVSPDLNQNSDHESSSSEEEDVVT
jgi:hypothetical protein